MSPPPSKATPATYELGEVQTRQILHRAGRVSADSWPEAPEDAEAASVGCSEDSGGKSGSKHLGAVRLPHSPSLPSRSRGGVPVSGVGRGEAQKPLEFLEADHSFCLLLMRLIVITLAQWRDKRGASSYIEVSNPLKMQGTLIEAAVQGLGKPLTV